MLSLITEHPHLCLPLIITGNQVEVCVDGPLGRTYTIETSRDLTNWAPIASLRNTDGVLRFADPSTNNGDQRFYRLIQEF